MSLKHRPKPPAPSAPDPSIKPTPQIKLEAELENDLRQDLEDLRLKRIQDADAEQLRLANYRDELFRAGMRKELDDLIRFLRKKIEALPSASSGVRLWNNLQAERAYLEGLLGVAEQQLRELRR